MKRLLIALGLVSFFLNTTEAKKLTGTQVAFLNCSLVPMPTVTYRLKASQEQANKISALLCDETKFKACEARMNALPDKNGAIKLKPEGKEFIMKMITQMLVPVKEFFSHIQEHSGMVKPLIEESLKEHPSLDAKAAAGDTMATNALLIAFLTAPTDDIIAHFEERVTSIVELKKLSLELTYFLNDLTESFSPQVLQAYEELKQKLEAEKKNHAQLHAAPHAVLVA